MTPARGIFRGVVAGCFTWIILFGGLAIVAARCTP
jgi:hypothetical protein